MSEERRAATSLLELLIAVGLVAAAAAPLVYSLVWSRSGVVASVEEVLATAEAARTMEALKQIPFDWLPVGRSAGPVPEVEWDDGHFTQLPPRHGPRRRQPPPSAVLATLGGREPDSGAGGALLQKPRSLERFLAIEPFAQGAGATAPALKLVELSVRWKHPGGKEAATGTVRLSALVSRSN